MVQGNNVSVGASGAGGVEYFGFFPANKSVKVGTTVTFRMSSKSFEVHTATTGPGNPETEPTSYLGAIAAGASRDRASIRGASTRARRRARSQR